MVRYKACKMSENARMRGLSVNCKLNFIIAFHNEQLFPVNVTLICFIVVKQSCMINPVVRKINISHFKDSASHRKFA